MMQSKRGPIKEQINSRREGEDPMNIRNLRRCRGDGGLVPWRGSECTCIGRRTRTTSGGCRDIAPSQGRQNARPTCRRAGVIERRHPALDELDVTTVLVPLSLLRLVFLGLNLIRAGFARHGPHHFSGSGMVARNRRATGLRRCGRTSGLGPSDGVAMSIGTGTDRRRHRSERRRRHRRRARRRCDRCRASGGCHRRRPSRGASRAHPKRRRRRMHRLLIRRG